MSASATPVPGRDRLGILMQRSRSAFIWGAFALFLIFGTRFFFRDALRYVEWSEAVYRRFWPHRVALAIHVLTASVGLLVAPIQFSQRIRKRWPRFHRTVGWTYVTCALITATMTLRLSFYTDCRMCVPPFAIWSFLMFVTTGIAVLMAVRRNFDVHRQFMVRSWLLMNGFVLVRLDDLFHYPLPTGPGIERAAMIIWVVWVIPLLLAEMYFTWSPMVAGKRAKAQRPRDVE